MVLIIQQFLQVSHDYKGRKSKQNIDIGAEGLRCLGLRLNPGGTIRSISIR